MDVGDRQDDLIGRLGEIGAIELAAGVPFPSWALEIMRFAVAPQHLQELVYRARTYEPEDGLRLGMLDEVVEPDDLMERAVIDHRTAAIDDLGTRTVVTANLITGQVYPDEPITGG